jgi:hypothetical protein
MVNLATATLPADNVHRRKEKNKAPVAVPTRKKEGLPEETGCG